MKQELKELLVVQEGMLWATIQNAVHNAVVQVCAQVIQFNWLEPYSVEDQFENRGSGFIIDEQGSIITNAHVVNEASHIWIYIPILGQQPVQVKLVSCCPDLDVALLRIVPTDLKNIKKILKALPILVFGNSDELSRAQGVMAMGYPLGQYQIKSSTGVVSGRESILGRSLIQITAPINMGSSGGPLLNIKGEVVGVTVAMASQASSIGYALASNDILMVIEDMFAQSFVKTPFLGARFVYANDKKTLFLSNPEPAGLYISTVFKNSLFDKIGIQSGDMLYSCDGHKIDAFGDTDVAWTTDKVSLYDLIMRVKIGETIALVIYRKGVKKVITCKISVEEPFAIRMRYPSCENIEYEIIAGLVIMELAENHLEYLKAERPDLAKYMIPENRLKPVLIITSILSGSLAHICRTLSVGDVIRTINKKEVSTLAELRYVVEHNELCDLFAIETDCDILAVFSWEEIIADENRLSKACKYPISEMVKKVQKNKKMQIKK